MRLNYSSLPAACEAHPGNVGLPRIEIRLAAGIIGESKEGAPLGKPVQPGSLADKIHTDHPVAAAIISHSFGSLSASPSREELAKHAQAILPDGFMSRGAFVERRLHMMVCRSWPTRAGAATRGERSLVRDLESRGAPTSSARGVADQLTRNAAEYFPEHTSLLVDLARSASCLPRSRNSRAISPVSTQSTAPILRRRNKRCRSWSTNSLNGEGVA